MIAARRAAPARRTARVSRFAFLVALAASCPGAAAGDKQADLQALKGRIEALRQDLGREEESRIEAADQLKEIEEGISGANRRLRELAEQEEQAAGELAQLQQQSEALQGRIGTQQETLGRLLYRHYLAGENDALGQLLAGGDPNQAARDLQFLRYLSRDQAELIRRLSEDLEAKRALTQRASAQREEISALSRRQEQERADLLAQQGRRKALLSRIADRIRSQRREIETLKRDERRMARLVEGLARIIAKPASPPPEPAGPPKRTEELAEPFAAETDFVTLKGRLRPPIRGKVATRYGASRPGGGGISKGLFIRSESGAEVKAVASGRVVFAEWLRGFGNLMILDHGDGYLTIYGNNESLYKSVGQNAASGEPIATVGSTGGNTESGLYFELRHEGQPIDPLKWINLR